MELSGHTALITGAGQGIGEACAEVFSERGADLILLDKNRKTLPQVADRLASKGGKVVAKVIDLTQSRALHMLIEELKSETLVDILVNNAGFDRPGVTAKVGKKDLNAVLGTVGRDSVWGRMVDSAGRPTLPEAKAALLQHYREMRESMMATLKGLSDERVVETSLDGWSIKDHLAHLAFWDEIRAAEVARITAGNESVWRMTPEQEAEYNRIGYDLRRGLSLVQVRWEYGDSRRQLIAAIQAANDRGLDGSNYGEAALKSSHEALHARWIKAWRTAAGI